MDEVRYLKLREAVLMRRGQEGPLSSVEAVELELVRRLIREYEAGYQPVGVAA